MGSEIILALKNISVEILVIAFIVFTLTMLLKLPIKKFTSKFDDNKRKSINTIIIFIPAILSLVLSILYFGIFQKTWFCLQAFEMSLSIYFLALTIYAIFSRTIILFKGLKSGKVKINSKEAQKSINEIRTDLSTLTTFFDSKQKDINQIMDKINELKILKDSILNSNTENSLVSIEDIDNKISELIIQKTILENDKQIKQQGENL